MAVKRRGVAKKPAGKKKKATEKKPASKKKLAAKRPTAKKKATGVMACAQSEEQDRSAHHPAQSAKPGAATLSHDHGAGKASPVEENMKKIEALMQQVQQTTDPAQKRELLSQHLEAMREQMRPIRSQHPDIKMRMKEGSKREGGMMRGMMKEGGKMGGGMMMHKKVEQRLEILERMLQQMIEHEAAEVSIEHLHTGAAPGTQPAQVPG